jgi:hypothetical protein
MADQLWNTLYDENDFNYEFRILLHCAEMIKELTKNTGSGCF